MSGPPGSGPNAVHRLAADLIGTGGKVWTTNWDTWIEQAWSDRRTRTDLSVAVATEDDPMATGCGLFKLHGTTTRPESLRFATPDIMLPLPNMWHEALVQAAAGKLLLVVGYGGADVDLFPALAEAVREAQAAYWFEGMAPAPIEKSALAAYAEWRFRLEHVVDPARLPGSGSHLVWCGGGSTVASPSEGLLTVFDYGGDVSDLPSWPEQFEAVDIEISQAAQGEKRLGPRLQLSARVSERLGRRWTAGLHHAAVVVIGPMQHRQKSLRSLGNLVLLRAQPLRTAATRIAVRLTRSEERAEFLVSQAGGVNHDPERAARIADGSEDVSVDTALTVAGAARWAGDLTVAERIARAQFGRALGEDLSSTERDWPERVSRACFEIAQALTWQGRFYEAEDQARSAYMRVSGAKWTAWEYTFRANGRFAEGKPDEAGEHLAMALKLLKAEGFHDFTPQVWCARAACERALGDLDAARQHVAEAERTPRKGPGSLAAILAERAEIAHAAGLPASAAASWSALCESQLPLWSGIGHLRLAEQGDDRDRNARVALSSFESIRCQWGTLRTAALLGRISDTELDSRASALGPVAVFRPGGQWMFY